jgi:secondary thiamine-phosphate synthase enzyme
MGLTPRKSPLAARSVSGVWYVRKGLKEPMQLSSAPGVTTLLRRLVLKTSEPIQFLDITQQVVDVVRAAGLSAGVVTVFSRHTTAAVCIQEDEPLLLEDLRQFLGRVAPAQAHYRHNDFRIRTQHMHEDESPNGHAHCLQLTLGASESVPVLDGDLQLGTWQRIFLVELDGPRPERQVLVQVLGSTE